MKGTNIQNIFQRIIIVILLSRIYVLYSDEITNSTKPDALIQKDIYKTLFKRKHSEQLQVVKQIISKADYSKQFKIIQIMLDGIAKVVGPAKVLLENEGYIPGNGFPTKETIKDALSLVLENTVLFSEILLRLPDITHHHLKRHKDNNLFTWAVLFCLETKLVDDISQELLTLATHELKLVPEDPSYNNPYRMKVTPKEQIVEPVKPKKERTRTRGPKLSHSRHTEL